MRPVKPSCINGHPYEPSNTRWRPDGKYYCATCYMRRQRYYKARKRGILAASKPRSTAADRILDLLLVDGGWLTMPGIAVALNLPEPAVYQALYRMRRQGHIEERVVEMASSPHVRRNVERRREWRHSKALEAWA